MLLSFPVRGKRRVNFPLLKLIFFELLHLHSRKIAQKAHSLEFSLGQNIAFSFKDSKCQSQIFLWSLPGCQSIPPGDPRRAPKYTYPKLASKTVCRRIIFQQNLWTFFSYFAFFSITSHLAPILYTLNLFSDFARTRQIKFHVKILRTD